MGPLLYSLLRFLKPVKCLEIGAGYTSAFLLQALEDNHRELSFWSSWCPKTWIVPGAEERRAPRKAERAPQNSLRAYRFNYKMAVKEVYRLL